MNIFGRNKKDKVEVNYLELTPVRNYEYQAGGEEGLIDILVPRFTDKFFGKFLQPKMKNKYIRANMDKFGTETWLLIDGNKKVGEIATELTEKFGDEIQPVNDRLTQFLTNLYKNDFISFNEFTKGKKNG